MSTYVAQTKSKKPIVSVKVHNSPTQSTPRIPPTSPDMIPAFDYTCNDAANDPEPFVLKESKPLLRRKNVAYPTSRDVVTNSSRESKISKFIKTQQTNKDSQLLHGPQLKIPLQLHKLKTSAVRKSTTLTDINKAPKNPHIQHRRAYSSRNLDKNGGDENVLKTFFSSEFPPYNPADFAPEEAKSEESDDVNSQVTKKDVFKTNYNQELLKKIRQELDEWMAGSLSSEKKTSPEQWSSLSKECKEDDIPHSAVRPPKQFARKPEKKKSEKGKPITQEKNPSKENAAPPPREQMVNKHNMSLAHLAILNGPKTPSPFPKSKLLEEADQLLCLAEREFTLVEAKLCDHLSSNKSSARCTSSQLPSARRTMTDFLSSPTKDSVIRDFSKQEDSKEVYQVPRNSPASFCKIKDKEKYMITNGEKKNVKSKLLCTHHTSVKNINQQDEQIKTNSYQRPDNMDIHPVLTYCNVIQNEQRLISEKTQQEGENNVPASKDGSIKNLSLKKNVETNTDTEYVGTTMMPVTSNSSIINMKTSKPECEDQMFGAASSTRLLNIQKMPSVNIRPEFTIQSGPKINIASSSKSLYEVKRRNTEFFDVVYPANSSLPTGSETRREIQSSLGSRMEHVCERHVFPSGKIIPGVVGDALRASYNVNDVSVEDKKAVLMDLIKSVCDKINKQETKGNNCRRLEYSLPLLASVVKKIAVDCVRCEEGLNRQIDTLIQLMKEEIRSHKEFSEEHCSQLIETVQYQIVELDLMQDDNSKEQSPTVKVFKHQENNGDSNVFKKTVSFENMQSELMRTSNTRKNEVKVVPNKNMSSKNKAESKTKPLLKSYNSQISGEVQNTSGNRNKLMDKKSIKPKIQDRKIVNAIKTSHITPQETKNTSEGYKKKTIVEQVMKNMSSKKPILKKDMSSINHASKEPSCNLNVLYKIVDKKETSNEFDQWIEERSLKIQRIHDELNNIVSRSTERYLETNSGETQTIKEQIRTKYDKNSNKEDSGKEFTSSPYNKDQLAYGSGEEEDRKESEEPCLSSSVQESNQDYVDDFEEDHDEEEGEEKDDRNIEDSINNNYENPIEQEGESLENTNEVAEAENGSSSSSKTSEIFTNENFEPILMQQEEFKREIQGTYKTSDKDERDGYSDAVGTVLSVQELTEGSENQNQSKEKSQIKPDKVSIATSPITFGSSGEITLFKPNGLTSNKITIATSPINEVSKKTLEVETKMVQTETPSNDSSVITNNKPHVEISRDDKPLQAPTFKLNPTPIENIVHVSLGQSSDSSLALQSSSTNQNIKLVVQLPNLSKGTEDNKKNIELDNLELQEQKQSLRKPNYHLRSQGERNTEFVNENNVPSAKYQNELPTIQEVGQIFTDPIYQSLNEKTIQDIIEPTVSEVLKKMNNAQSKLTPGISGHTEVENNTINKYMPIYTEPSKPNIVLQTKHGLWKKCDDSPVYGFLDLECATHVIDSSNQTETEKKTVYTQVAASLAGSLTDKAVSVHNEEAAHTSRRSYIEMLQPLPPLPTALNTTGSSSTHSSLFRTSSARTSSPTSTSSNRKSGHNSDHFLGYLSEGEILPKICQCLFGEVCGVCIPKLDLSVGELKTKRRKEKRNTILESGSDSHQITSISSEKDSLARVPKSPLLEDLEILSNDSKANSKSGAKHLNQQMGLISENDLIAHCSQTIPVSGNVQIDTRKLTSKPFSEVVDSVMCELNKENLKIKKHNVRNRHINSGSFKNINLSANKLTDSSSSSYSVKSGQSVSASSSHERKLKYRNESRVPFVMKPPHESAKINVIVEDNDEVSISSYQTSVTSVSVDNLPAALSSYSSGEI